MTQTPIKPPSAPAYTFEADKVQHAIADIIEAMGDPSSPCEVKALEAFQREEYATVDLIAASHLSNHYCRALGYLGSAVKLSPGTAKILAEAARAAADRIREQALASLSESIDAALLT